MVVIGSGNGSLLVSCEAITLTSADIQLFSDPLQTHLSEIWIKLGLIDWRGLFEAWMC